jgi:uncharacterized protein (TIGR02172 family)
LDTNVFIGKGRTADVYAWGEGRILKLYQSWMPAIVVEREYAITQAARAVGMPVPATYELVEVEGRHGIVFERIVGGSLLAELEAKPWKLFAAARQLGELHAQIHGCRAPVELPTQRQQIENGIAASQDLAEADKQALQSCLAQLPDGEALCHGDFHPDNILISAQGPIIIDWPQGTRGDPLADVARTSLLFQTAGLPPGTPVQTRLIINASRAALLTLYLNHYLQLRPGGRQQIERWRLPLMAARLREVENYPQEKRLLLARLKVMLQEPS